MSRRIGHKRFQNRVINPVVRRLLLSPGSRTCRRLCRAVALLTVTGRTTGRPYTTPVMYAQDDDAVFVLVNRPEHKTWWRNLRRPAPVRLVLRCREVQGVAELVSDPDELRSGLQTYRARFPRSASVAGGDARLVRIRPRSVPSVETPHHRKIVVSRYGGPEVLRAVAEPVPEPGPAEVRIKVTAAGVSFTDVLIREGVYPGGPRPPFTPGYEVVGTVDAVGANVRDPAPGDSVAALLVHGGYAEYVCAPAAWAVPMPDDLDPAEAVCLPLTYVTAYQLLRRAATVRLGDRVLVQGAAGAVGVAALQLGRELELRMYGTGAAAQAHRIRELDATPIDYQSEDVVARVRRVTGGGADAVLDGIGGAVALSSLRALRPGGRLVLYGHSGAVSRGRRNVRREAAFYGAGALALTAGVLPGGPHVSTYRIAIQRDRHPDWYREDLSTLFDLLAKRRIAPMVADRLELDDVAAAHERIGRGQVAGRQVILMSGHGPSVEHGTVAAHADGR